MNDLLAELDGYRKELDYCAGRDAERATAVKQQMERVTGQVRQRVEQLLAQADNHETAGQDVLAAQARVEAKRLARGAGLRVTASAQVTDAADARPMEKAVPKRAPKSKEGA